MAEAECYLCSGKINLELKQINEKTAKENLCKTHLKAWKKANEVKN